MGSINTDLVAIADRIPAVEETVLGTGFQVHGGGKGANQAVAVARLGYPARMIGLGRSPLDSAIFAAAVAAISVTRVGAQPSMPSMLEVETFLQNHAVQSELRPFD